MSKKNQTIQYNKPPVSWPECVRDIVNKATDQGQSIFLFVCVIITIILLRTPESIIGELITELIHKSYNIHDYAILLFFICIAGWYYHVKTIRDEYKKETKRIGQEKSLWQEKAMNMSLTSSGEGDN